MENRWADLSDIELIKIARIQAKIAKAVFRPDLTELLDELVNRILKQYEERSEK